MATIVYNPDGDDLTLEQALSRIAEDLRNGAFPEKLFIYGDFNKSTDSFIEAISSMDFNNSGLHDALGLLISNFISSVKSKEELKSILAVYQRFPRPSPAIQQQISIRVTQWAQQNMIGLDDLEGVFGF